MFAKAKQMLNFANAKINLGLSLVGKRTDGYHNLETVFYPVKIYDAIELIDAQKTEIELCGITIPGQADDNLCLQVFRNLQKDFKLPHQKIVLLKNIPVGAGLGGGSADAAFLLKLINQKFALQLTDTQLENYARKFGSDCAFFIRNKPCFAFEKGDVFEDLAALNLTNYFMVLVKPPIHVSTAEAYRDVEIKKTEKSLKELIHLPVSEWKTLIKNDFEPSVFKKYPLVEAIKTSLYDAGALFSLMSGSGSAVFGIFEHPVQLPDLEKHNLVFYNV